MAATPRSVFTFATAELSDEDEGGDDDDEGQSGNKLVVVVGACAEVC
jgi:hypothetical protein